MLHLHGNIRLIRQVWQETQEEFGSRYGASKAMIKSYESGKASPNDLFISRLCKDAGVNENDIINKKLKDTDIKQGQVEKVEVGSKIVKPDNLLTQLMRQQNQLMETQNRILSEMKDGIQNKVERIDKMVEVVDTNLNSISDVVSSTWLKASAAIDVSLKSLARLEKKSELSLIDEKDKELERLLPSLNRKGTHGGRRK